MPNEHPTLEMVKDLAAVFKNHDWTGQPIGLAKAAVPLAADEVCPDGSAPQWVSYKLPNGTWAQKKMCL